MSMEFKNTLVGYIDIQGFSSFVKRAELDEVRKLLSELQNESVHNQTDMFGVKTVSKQISDSFILTIDTTELDFNGFSLVVLVSTLSSYLAAAHRAGIPVRGAVGAGYYYDVNNMTISDGLVDAVEMEKKQDWYGIAFSERAVNFCKANLSQFEAGIEKHLAHILCFGEIPLKPERQECGSLNRRKAETYYIKPLNSEFLSFDRFRNWAKDVSTVLKERYENTIRLYKN